MGCTSSDLWKFVHPVVNRLFSPTFKQSLQAIAELPPLFIVLLVCPSTIYLKICCVPPDAIISALKYTYSIHSSHNTCFFKWEINLNRQMLMQVSWMSKCHQSPTLPICSHDLFNIFFVSQATESKWIQMNIWKFIYLNCREWYEDIHWSSQLCNCCKIKTWKKIQAWTGLEPMTSAIPA